MSPKKQPCDLNSICIKILSNQLIHALSDEEGIHQHKVSKYIYSATYDTLESLLQEILGLTINLDASIRFSCLQVLLRMDVKTLETGIFPRFYYDKILETIRDQGKGLHYLNLKGVWARDFSQLLSESIVQLSKLKRLIIPHMADDSVLHALSGLKNLVKLDISGEACYSSDGIRKLKSDSIRILDIGSFGKPDLCPDTINGFDLVADIITNLPNLNVLKTYSFTGHALLSLYKKNQNFKTKLTYIHTTDCDEEMLEAVQSTCPLLENAHINQPKDGVVMGLGKLRRLNTLKLTKGNSNELLSLLQRSGEQLQLLKLNHNKSAYLDLSDLCQYAPYVTCLEFYHMGLSCSNADAYFMNLQKIQFLYCDINDTLIKTVLANSPFLKSITVGCSVEMTDGDMFRLLSECSLDNLEELLFSEARFLTPVTVGLLMDNCPKLKILGSLMGWDITQEEIDALKLLVKLSNIDLTLWPLICI